jgi:hypothetical protein
VENHQNLMVYHHHKSGHFGALPHFQTYPFFLANPRCWWPIPITIPIVDGNIP